MTRHTRFGLHLRTLLLAAVALAWLAPRTATSAPARAVAFDFEQAYERVDPTFNYEGPDWVLYA